MTKSRKSNTLVKRRKKPNPMTQRKPRIKMGPRSVSFDGQFGNFRSVFAVTTTDASKQLGASYALDCRSSGSVIGGTGSGVAALYSQFVYESCTFRWFPAVAPGVADAGSQLYIGYLDNPEMINTFLGLTNAQKISAIQSMKNVKFFNAWEQFTYSVPITRRKPTFDVNVTITDSADTDDRSLQGIVVVSAESQTASFTLGRFVADSVIKLMELVNFPS